MEKSYTETFALRTGQCDMQGQWKPGAILDAMQETATVHCNRLGLSRAATDAMGIVWVLSRSSVSLERAPRLGETVSVETWPLPPRHLFFPRANAFRDAAGEVIGGAMSLWVLMDVRTRAIVGSDAVLARLPKNDDMPAGIPLGAVRPLAGEAVEETLCPPYSDFDLNGHVNNTRYLDWTCSALGHAAMAERRVRRFSICYEREVRPDETIRTELVRQGDLFSFCGFAEAHRCFCVNGELMER